MDWSPFPPSGARVPDRLSPDRPRIRPDDARRALGLRAVRVGPALYHVTGGRGDYHVTLDPEMHCDCGSFLWVPAVSPKICKHLVRALAEDGDEAAVEALALAAEDAPRCESHRTPRARVAARTAVRPPEPASPDDTDQRRECADDLSSPPSDPARDHAGTVPVPVHHGGPLRRSATP